MAPVLATLQLQVMYQFVIPEGSSFENGTADVNISTSPLEPETLPTGYIAYPEMNAAYKFHDEEVSWTEARKRCVAEGAQLAVIDTPKKLELLKPTATGIHVGIHSLFDENDWVSVKDGARVSTPQWRSGEPSGSGRCVSLWSDGTGLGNFVCTGIGRYMCELPIPKS